MALPVPALRDRARARPSAARLDKVTLRLPRPGRVHAGRRLRALQLVLLRAGVPRDHALAAREGVRRGGPDDRRERPADRPLAHPPAPRRAAHRASRRSTSPAFILAEAGLSFLGLGIQLPTASWGNLLADAPNFYLTRPLLMLWPGSRARLHDARVQPARRRPARRVRPARQRSAAERPAAELEPILTSSVRRHGCTVTEPSAN